MMVVKSAGSRQICPSLHTTVNSLGVVVKNTRDLRGWFLQPVFSSVRELSSVPLLYLTLVKPPPADSLTETGIENLPGSRD